MAKRKESESERRLLEAWEPPDGAGEPIGCVATTFTFDPGFFEEHCLSRFLQLETDPREDGAAYLVEREEKLAVTNVSVLVDRSNMDGSASPRWTVLPVTVPRGIFHPKISILAWHNWITVVVGSANLTEPAYRKNQEVFGLLDFHDDGDVPVSFLVETLDFLDQILTLMRGSEENRSPKQRLRSFLATVRDKAAKWTSIGLKRNDWPRVVPVFLGPFDQFKEPIPIRLGRLFRERGSPASAVNVLSPFFDRADEKVYPANEAIINALTDRGSREVNFCLAAETLPDKTVRLRAPASVTRHGRKIAHMRIYPVFEDIEGEIRPLHAKSIWLWNDRWHLYMVGSSNFTTAGLGLDNACNVEANIAYVFPEENRFVRAMEQTLPPWGEEIWKFDEVLWEPISEEEGENPAAKPVLPTGFEEALFEPGETGGILKLSLGSKLPTWWEIYPAENGARLYTSAEWDSTRRNIELPWSLPQVPHVLEVQWRGEDGTMLSARWPVNVSDMSRLPPPDALRNLSLETLIEILGSRLPLHEAVAMALKKVTWIDMPVDQRIDPELDPLRRYGSETFLLQRTRRVAKAIEQLMQNLGRPVFHRESLLWRLRGPVGPLSLARALRKAASSPGEAAFLLLDLYLALQRIDAAKISIGVEPADALTEITSVKDEIRRMAIDCLESNDIPVSMRQYVSNVISETPQ